MYRDTRVGVVVPAYNESDLVATVVETMPEFVDRVYVVDDSSTDDTWQHVQRAAERANRRARQEQEEAENEKEDDDAAESAETDEREQAREPAKADGGEQTAGLRASSEPRSDGGVGVEERVVPIRHEENRGVGGAVTTGYSRALDDDVDVIAVMNGDAQMDPDELPRLLDPIVAGEAEYAKGNRLLEADFREGMTNWRLLGNWSLTFLTKVASGYWKTMDPQNGYTAISADALETLGPEDFYQDYGFCNDVLVKLNAHGYTVADVPMAAVYGDETSSIEYSSFIPKLSSLLVNRFVWRLHTKYLVRDFHPLALFYLFGVASMAVGGVAGLAALVSGSEDAGEDGNAVGSPQTRGIAALVLLPVGCLALLTAMTLDMRANRDKEVRAE
ncbi:glycosyltransferase family 2 protein [Halorussus ruber]|uniref:glycosyltransferase family 2 protein n=1 Tax=Halorussus ruber TaxID=1126238 RepID=UPI001091FEB8|nr:glycosyltransferase family 2 protein [Halorussus ruber]